MKLRIKNAIITADCRAFRNAYIRAIGESVPRGSAVPGWEEEASRETRAYLKGQKRYGYSFKQALTIKEEGL